MEIINSIPAQAWTIVAVSVAALLLFIGVKILRSKKVDIHVGKDGVDVDLEMSRGTTDVTKKPVVDNPIKALNSAADHFTDLGK